jgi:signal transduction histidine kinase
MLSDEARAAMPDAHFVRQVRQVSHEMSTPLETIKLNLEHVAGCSPDEVARWQQCHAIVSAEVQRLAGVIDNLRLLAHLEARDAPAVREPVNLKAVAEDVIVARYEAAEARHVRLRYVGPDRPARVLGDREQLRQVLLNLVDNGIKYSKQPDGGDVIVGVHEEQDRLCVRVSDEGIGIAEEDLAHIFDPAYRALDARSFRRQGSGLGLTIVERIVEQHGGRMRVESRLGEGTTLSFDLPLYVPSQAPQA